MYKHTNKSRIITRRGAKFSKGEGRGEGEGYLIFVNFGTYTTALFRLVQVHQKVEDHYEERREESKTCGDQEK